MKYLIGFSGLIIFSMVLGYFLNDHQEEHVPVFFGLLLLGSLLFVPMMIEIFVKARSLKTDKVSFAQMSKLSFWSFVLGVFFFFLGLGYLIVS